MDVPMVWECQKIHLKATRLQRLIIEAFHGWSLCDQRVGVLHDVVLFGSQPCSVKQSRAFEAEE